MANYLFEQMSESDAANFESTSDNLFFLTGSASTVVVTENPETPLSNASVTLTSGGKSLIFAQSGLAGEEPTFFSNSNDASTLTFGSETDEAENVPGTAGSTARYFAFGGDDTINGSAASDTIYGSAGNDTINGANAGTPTSLESKADYLFGGAGDDIVNGSVGNDHIYGNVMTSVAGAEDGADTLNGDGGNDYIQGNAGADTINGGDDNDRLYGGADADSVSGGEGNDYLQGNKGNDTLSGDDGIDTLRGGAGADSLSGGDDDDFLSGDNGADTIDGGEGYDKLTGGAGNDVFFFAAGDADNANVGATGADADVTDAIFDFTDGEDLINLDIDVNGVAYAEAGVTFTTVSAAQTYAESLLEANVEVAAINVGADTYLFYDDSGATTIDSVIKVIGVDAATFEADDFAPFVV